MDQVRTRITIRRVVVGRASSSLLADLHVVVIAICQKRMGEKRRSARKATQELDATTLWVFFYY